MQAGLLRYPITIQRFSEVELASGQLEKSWTNLIELLSAINYKHGSEGYEADQKVASLKPVFTVHNVVTVTPKDRIRYNDQYYGIDSVIPIDQDVYLELEAMKRDNTDTE